MKSINLVIALILLVAAQNVFARQAKMLVCHVGNDAGPGGETYLDDPDCVPSDLNNYFCPDAGKIDLIVIAEKAAANHLSNSSHYWDGISDYDPLEMGASGDGTEDTDGDGIDEGCEIAGDCPCWDEVELQQVTAANQDSFSCSDPEASDYPLEALIQDDAVLPDGIEGGFLAINSNDQRLCTTRDEFRLEVGITAEEANACIEQIADRCAAIGSDIRGN